MRPFCPLTVIATTAHAAALAFVVGTSGCYLSHERAGAPDSGPMRPPAECPAMPVGMWVTDTIDGISSPASLALAADPVCGVHVVTGDDARELVYLRERADGTWDREALGRAGVVGFRGLVVSNDAVHVAFFDDGLWHGQRDSAGGWTFELVDELGFTGAIGVTPEGSPLILYPAGVDTTRLFLAERAAGRFLSVLVDGRQSFEPIVVAGADRSVHLTYLWVTSPETHATAYAVRPAGETRFAIVDVEERERLQTESTSALVVTDRTTHVFYPAFRRGGGKGLRHASGEGTLDTFEWIDDIAANGMITGAATADRTGELHVVYRAPSGEIRWAHGRAPRWEIETLPAGEPSEITAAHIVVDGARVAHAFVFERGTMRRLRRAL